MAEYKTYKDLDVWVKARAFVKEIYLSTKDFPKDELYGLVSQMRRSAISIPSNIAEGYGRQYKKESIQFFHIARGSLYELETQLYIAADLNYLQQAKLPELILLLEECRKLLGGLIKYFETNLNLK
ncbi:four helix bundle protein [Chitinophagaceae bacterium IBVUCB2]|nr:four helix bundle protein [Chitinophagaceae bacterium IBVUCB2]